MAQQFRALVDFVEDLGLVLSTHMVTQTIHKSSFRNLACAGTRHTCGSQTYMQAKYSFTF